MPRQRRRTDIMNKRRVWLLGGLAALAAVGVGLLIWNNLRGRDDQIEIGAVLVLSGDNALWGENAQKAMQLVVDEVNEEGGIDGKKLVIRFEDSKGEAKTAVTAFRNLVNLRKVPIVLGDMLTSTT